jgi:hypothetical protein
VDFDRRRHVHHALTTSPLSTQNTAWTPYASARCVHSTAHHSEQEGLHHDSMDNKWLFWDNKDSMSQIGLGS